jgi:hypothetical protein
MGARPGRAFLRFRSGRPAGRWSHRRSRPDADSGHPERTRCVAAVARALDCVRPRVSRIRPTVAFKKSARAARLGRVRSRRRGSAGRSVFSDERSVRVRAVRARSRTAASRSLHRERAAGGGVALERAARGDLSRSVFVRPRLQLRPRRGVRLRLTRMAAGAGSARNVSLGGTDPRRMPRRADRNRARALHAGRARSAPRGIVPPQSARHFRIDRVRARRRADAGLSCVRVFGVEARSRRVRCRVLRRRAGDAFDRGAGAAKRCRAP